jgi:molybdopterin/thiamine biosynthesis adenylyltransferase
MTPAQLEVSQYLTSQGFALVSRRKEKLQLRGKLACQFGDVPIEITIKDWDFIRYPSIRVMERPACLDGVQAHLSSLNGLCYFTAGAVLLERYKPVNAIVQCLDQATLVLNELARDPTYRQGEFIREYLANWHAGQHPPPLPVVKGSIADKTTHMNVTFAEGGEFPFAMFGDDVDQLRSIVASTGRTLRDHGSNSGWVFHTDCWPPISEGFPRTVQDLFTWAKAWDPNICQALQDRLGYDRTYLDLPILFLMIQSPAGWLGLTFELGNELQRTIGKRKPTNYRQWLHRHSQEVAVTRLSVLDWSPEFVYARNLGLEQTNLLGKCITLIGGGSIGSHVAKALVQMGAGQGKRGRLRIVDNDDMEGGNVSRNLLGYPSLFKSKATELAAELRRLHPTANVKGEVGDVLKVEALFRDDLVIDATGEEALSEAINVRHLAAGASARPVLYVRIYGQGDAIQALWVDAGHKGACFACLRKNDPQSQREPRFRIGKTDEPQWLMRGCQAITPYAVSAPMHAAAMVSEMVADWLQGNVSPRLRFLERPNADVFHNQNPEPLPHCPACSTAAQASKVG